MTWQTCSPPLWRTFFFVPNPGRIHGTNGIFTDICMVDFYGFKMSVNIPFFPWILWVNSMHGIPTLLLVNIPYMGGIGGLEGTKRKHISAKNLLNDTSFPSRSYCPSFWTSTKHIFRILLPKICTCHVTFCYTSRVDARNGKIPFQTCLPWWNLWILLVFISKKTIHHACFCGDLIKRVTFLRGFQGRDFPNKNPMDGPSWCFGVQLPPIAFGSPQRFRPRRISTLLQILGCHFILKGSISDDVGDSSWCFTKTHQNSTYFCYCRLDLLL